LEIKRRNQKSREEIKNQGKKSEIKVRNQKSRQEIRNQERKSEKSASNFQSLISSCI